MESFSVSSEVFTKSRDSLMNGSSRLNYPISSSQNMSIDESGINRTQSQTDSRSRVKTYPISEGEIAFFFLILCIRL